MILWRYNSMSNSIYKYLLFCFNGRKSIIIFELGAHIGQDTEKLIIQFPKSTIYSFECDPRNINTIKNKSLINKINLIECAIYKEDGNMQFYQSDGHPPQHDRNNTASSSLYKPTGHLKKWDWVKFRPPIRVKTRSLDSFCKEKNINNIDFIWCDIQGGEYDMILGAQNILKSTKYLYTEYSNTELYEGQKNMNDLLAILPGKWSAVKDFKSDVL